MNKMFLMILIVAWLTSGCAIKGDYTCGVPENGVRCQPMDVTHQQLYDGTLNSLHTKPYPEPVGDSQHSDDDDFADEYGLANEQPANRSVVAASAVPAIKTIESKQAILSQPREMRIWFDRFTDVDGDLHDESFVFIRLDNGHWLIDNKPVLY